MRPELANLLAKRVAQVLQLVPGQHFDLLHEATYIAAVVYQDYLELARELKGKIDPLPVPMVGDAFYALSTQDFAKAAAPVLSRFALELNYAVTVTTHLFLPQYVSAHAQVCSECDCVHPYPWPRGVGLGVFMSYWLLYSVSFLSHAEPDLVESSVALTPICSKCMRDVVSKLLDELSSAREEAEKSEPEATQRLRALWAKLVFYVEPCLFQLAADYIYRKYFMSRYGATCRRLEESIADKIEESFRSLLEIHRMIADEFLTHVPEAVQALEKVAAKVDALQPLDLVKIVSEEEIEAALSTGEEAEESSIEEEV